MPRRRALKSLRAYSFLEARARARAQFLGPSRNAWYSSSIVVRSAREGDRKERAFENVCRGVAEEDLKGGEDIVLQRSAGAGFSGSRGSRRFSAGSLSLCCAKDCQRGREPVCYNACTGGFWGI